MASTRIPVRNLYNRDVADSVELLMHLDPMQKVALIHLMNFASSVGYAHAEDPNAQKEAVSMLNGVKRDIMDGDDMVSAAAKFERYKMSLL